MPKKPLVSVVIPVYNAERTIAETLTSVLAQTYTNLEILVIDDASTDRSPAILQTYAQKDPRIKLLTNSTNQKVAATRNRGIAAAQGEYLAFLDADDLWAPDKIARQIDLMTTHDYPLTFTATEFIDDAGHPTGKVFSVPDRVDYRQLLRQNVITFSSACVRTAIAKRHPLHNAELHEDFIFWLEILQTDVEYAYALNEPLTQYRLTTGSKSRNKWQSMRMTYRTYRAMHLNFFSAHYHLMFYILRGLKKYHHATTAVMSQPVSPISKAYHRVKTCGSSPRFELANYAVLTILLFLSCFFAPFTWVATAYAVVTALFYNENQLLKLAVYLASFKLCLQGELAGHTLNLKTLAVLVLLLFIALRLVVSVLSQRRKITWRVLVPAALLGVYLLLGFVRHRSITNLVNYLLIIFVFYVLYEVKDKIKIADAVKFFCLGLIMASLCALFEPLSPRLQGLLPHLTYYGYPRFAGLFSHPNNWAVFGITALGSLLYLKAKNQISHLEFLALYLPLVAFGVLTVQRSFLLAFLIGLALFGVYYLIRYRQRSLVLLVSVVILTAAVMGIFYQPTAVCFGRLGQGGNNDFSGGVDIPDFSNPDVEPGDHDDHQFWQDVLAGETHYDPGRIGIWQMYWHQITSSTKHLLFGNGLNAPMIGQMQAHNLVLQITYEIGLVGLLLIALLVLATLNWRQIKTFYCRLHKLIFLIPAGFIALVEPCLSNLTIFVFAMLVLTDYPLLLAPVTAPRKHTRPKPKSAPATPVVPTAPATVSVIVPIYNVARYLPTCLHALINQTYPHLEIILVDDGSPDACPQLCDAWAQKDPRVKVLHQTNGGLSNARNAGLAVATGQYVYFCDPDDYVDPTLIERLYYAIQGRELAIGGYRIINNDHVVAEYNLQELVGQDTATILSTLIHRWDFGLAWNKLYRRDLIDHPFDETFKVREDLLFNVEYFANVKTIAIVPTVLYSYLKRGDSLTATVKHVPFAQLVRVHTKFLTQLTQKNLTTVIPHQNAAFLKSLICLFKPYTKQKLTTDARKELLACLDDSVTQAALANCAPQGVAEKLFIYLLRKKQIRLLLWLIKAVRANG